MELTISGRHFDITDAIRQYVTEKVTKLPRYYDRITSIEVVADKVHDSHELEIIVIVEHSDPFITKVSADSLYVCVDEAVDKLERRLTDHKDKIRNRKHNVG